MWHWILASLGLLLALVAPRYRHGSLTGFAGFLALTAGAGFLLTRHPEVWQMALGLGLLTFVSLALARLLPRLVMVLALALTLAIAVQTLSSGRPTLRLVLSAVGLGLLVAGTLRLKLGLRMAWALAGASLVWGVGPSMLHGWAWIMTAAGLLLANWLTTLGVDDEPPEWSRSLRASGIAAVVPALAALGVPWWVPVLSPPSRDPQAARFAQVRKAAPGGGIIWPLPSEAITWGGNNDFPAFENLDALYLGGPPDGGPLKLPATSPWRGRFALNGDLQARRMIKDETEIERLRTASQAIALALKESLALHRAGGTERAIAESVRARYRAHGCDSDSFPPIVASGANALDFHYMKNDGALKGGDLVVVDVGCYADHYASDFTRTLPVGGQFTPHTRKLYEAVYKAEQAAARACKPGVYLYGRAARGGAKTLNMVARETLKACGVDSEFGHGIGHPLGLFVHDAFDRNQPLKPGMVIMIEPGLYLKDEKIGVRLEDAYLVTETGCELLTTGFPADPDSVERLLAEAMSPASR